MVQRAYVMEYCRYKECIIELQKARGDGALLDPEYSNEARVGSFERSPVKLMPMDLVSEAQAHI